jgi:6-pyruvoyltetrahydropterin/6-carboxytetrahydropterin synthase
MHKIKKTFRFEASHQLMGHDGKCARLHGHSWVVHVEFGGRGLFVSGPKENMLLDFGDVSKALKPIIDDELDHRHLNSVLGTEMPTSEFLAEWLFKRVQKLLPMVTAVEVEETCTSWCRYED